MSGIPEFEELTKLKQFVDICAANPVILLRPELSFFKEFIESFGGRIPSAPKMSENVPPKASEPAATAEEDSEPESDLEIDTEGCVEPDTISYAQKMGNADKEVTDEESDKSDEKRSAAMSEFSQGNFEKALELYSEAIELNPQSALLFAKRGQVYLKLMKPNACIKDCSRALELNPDSAQGYKFRGRAFRLLGEWEKSAKDLRQASNIDFDEQTDEWLKEVTPKALKIEQHRIKQERRKLEKDEKEKLEKLRKAREAHAEASKASAQTGPNFDSSNLFNLLQDPELKAAVSDPEVLAAFMDISQNPMNIMKYKSNPKIMLLVNKMSAKFGGAGFPNFEGAPGGETAPNQEFRDDDVLD